MEITVHGGLWHTDCRANRWNSGVMREVRIEKDAGRSLLECLHCGKQGYLPHGSVGRTCCEEVTASPATANFPHGSLGEEVEG